jgi:hypothetical protein
METVSNFDGLRYAPVCGFGVLITVSLAEHADVRVGSKPRRQGAAKPLPLRWGKTSSTW